MKLSQSQEELKRKALANKGKDRMVSEAKLQQQCVVWYKNTYPHYGKRLFAVFNEGKDVTHKLGVGLTPGVPDLLHVDIYGFLYGYEMKQIGTYHKVEHLIVQAKWMIEVLQGRGYFCDSLEAFQKAMEGDFSLCVNPEIVLKNCLRLKSKSVLWDNVKKYDT